MTNEDVVKLEIVVHEAKLMQHLYPFNLQQTKSMSNKQTIELTNYTVIM